MLGRFGSELGQYIYRHVVESVTAQLPEGWLGVSWDSISIDM